MGMLLLVFAYSYGITTCTAVSSGGEMAQQQCTTNQLHQLGAGVLLAGGVGLIMFGAWSEIKSVYRALN